MLAELIERYGADCWLVNTGWSGGAFGTGKRMSIQHTRALLAAVLDGSLANARFHAHPVFGLMMPSGVPRYSGRSAGPSAELGGQGGL